MNDINDYAFRKNLDLSFDAAIKATTEALKAEGFGVLTEIDVKETLKEKLGVDFRRYRILGACNPPFAHRALSADLDVGLLLPCNVVVYESDAGKSSVAAVNPMSMLALLEAGPLDKIAKEVSEKLNQVIESL